MNSERKWRLVCYDISDPKVWRRVHKLLRGIGRPVQYSIFRCRLDERETERLRWQLAQLMDPSDRLLIVDLCPGCAQRVVSRNHVEGWVERDPTFVVVARKQASARVAPIVVSRHRELAKTAEETVSSAPLAVRDDRKDAKGGADG